MRRVIYPAVALLMTALIGGCSFTHQLTVESRTDGLPSTTKHPVSAGVYYTPQFANQEYQRAVGPHIWVVPIGAASVRLFDDLYPRVFDKAIKISNLSPEELSAKGIDVVIAPSLEHFDFRTGMDADSDRYSVSYRMTLYNNQGVPVASWIVLGKVPSTLSFSSLNMIETWINQDMSDAATKFLLGFDRDAGPALAAIAKSLGGQAVALDLQGVVLTAKWADLPSLDAKQAATLQQAGVVPLKIAARSQSESGLVVRASDMRLRLKDGQLIEPSSVSSVLAILEGPSQSGAATAALTNAAFGTLVTYLANRSNQGERELQFRAGGQSLFGDRTLSAGKEETGIVLFRLPKDMRVVDGSTLIAWVVDPAAARGAQMAAPFGSGFADKGAAILSAVPVKAPITTGQVEPSPSASRSETISTAAAVTATPAPSPESEQFLKVGDRWKYKFYDRTKDVGSVTVEIIESSGHKVRERITRDGYKGFVAERDVEVAFRPDRFQAPIALPGGYLLTELAPYLPPGTELKAGQVWDNVPGIFFFPDIGKKTMVSRVKVVGQEIVRVPAGAFSSWRIEAESEDHSGIYPAKVKCTFWYSPETKRTMKMTIDSNRLVAYQSGGESYELASFDPGK